MCMKVTKKILQTTDDWTFYVLYPTSIVLVMFVQGISSESILQAFDDSHQTCRLEPSSIYCAVGFSLALLFTVFDTIFDSVLSEVSFVYVNHFSQTNVAACQNFLSKLPTQWSDLIEVLILTLESAVSFGIQRFLLVQIAARILYFFVGNLTFYRYKSTHRTWKFVVAFSRIG